MGVYVKALVVTTLLMEIATLVALTAVWAILTEFHVAATIVSGALVLTGAMLIVPGIVVFRLAVRAERQMLVGQGAPENRDMPDPICAPDPLTPPNFLDRAQPRQGLPNLSPGGTQSSASQTLPGGPTGPVTSSPE